MGMTSNRTDIEKLTGLKIGHVYLGEKQFDPQKQGNRILDCKSGNFHLFPILDSNNVNMWKEYFQIENKVWKELGKKLGKKFGIKAGSGELGGIPEDYLQNGCWKMNMFFKYIQIEKDGRYYVILLKRFFIDTDNSVNCKFGEVQFFSSKGKNINEFDPSGKAEHISTFVYYKKKLSERENSEVEHILVHYPRSYKGQNEKMIRLSDTKNKVNMYNPKDLTLNWESADFDASQCTDSIAKRFDQYISQIHELEKETS